MNIFHILLAEIGYRKLNFLLSLVAVTVAVMLFVAGPTLVDGYSHATESQLRQLQDRVAESADTLKLAEDEAAASLKQAEESAEEELFHIENETRKIMRDLGFNLTILHRDADTVEFLTSGRTTEDMPQQWIHELGNAPGLTMVTHLVATLGGKIEVAGRMARLRGYLPEVPQPHRPQTKFAQKRFIKRTPMGYDIKPGTVQIGHALGEGHQVGETLEVGGRQFTIATILPEKGNIEDITVAMHLDDAQALLDKPETINQILALECKCAEADLAMIRKQIGEALPDAHVIRDTSRADARARQRTMVKEKHQTIIAQQKEKYDSIIATHKRSLDEREEALEHTRQRREKIQSLMGTLARVITPLVVLVSAIWVGLLALANVRERRVEIGILRAIGKGSGMIATLFLGKAVVMGLVGAAVGLSVGLLLARMVGAAALNVGPEQMLARTDVLLAAMLGAPLLAAIASYLPTLSAVHQDPAVVLRDQ